MSMRLLLSPILLGPFALGRASLELRLVDESHPTDARVEVRADAVGKPGHYVTTIWLRNLSDEVLTISPDIFSLEGEDGNPTTERMASCCASTCGVRCTSFGSTGSRGTSDDEDPCRVGGTDASGLSLMESE